MISALWAVLPIIAVIAAVTLAGLARAARSDDADTRYADELELDNRLRAVELEHRHRGEPRP